jgi:hypothetical protein
VHSTVDVASGRGQPTVPELAGLLEDDKPLDRTTMNSWEDLEFVQAVHATGRRELIMCAVWTVLRHASRRVGSSFDASRQASQSARRRYSEQRTTGANDMSTHLEQTNVAMYYDRLVRTHDGSWRFAERRYYYI